MMNHLQLIYRDLSSILEERTAADSNAGLFCGDWGMLLYLFYYEQYIDPSTDNAGALLQKLYQQLNVDGAEGYTYCNGTTGPFWMLHHLNKQGIAALDIDGLVSGFLPAAITESQLHLEEQNFDFLHGSAGIVHFLIDFAHIPEVQDHLHFFVSELRRTARPQNGGVSFPTFTSHDQPEATDGLSMAHGTCALLIILAKLHQADICAATCKELIYGSLDLILGGRNIPDTTSPYASLYPEALNGKMAWSRLSWCYGDLCAALALWHCGRYFGEELWKREAIDIMTYNTSRTFEYSGIKDSCFCHGAAGAAVIYRKFWQETGIASFHDCSEYWFRLIENDLSFETHASQQGLKIATEGGWIYRSDLLCGSAGVGLALLSRLQDEPLAWPECFLISNTTDNQN